MSAVAYLVVFSVAAILLLVMARNGTGRIVVQACLVVFVVAATLWARDQFVDDLHARQWVLPGNVALIFVVGAVVALVIWSRTGSDGLGLAALYAFWLGGSALLTRMRDRTVQGKSGILQATFDACTRHRWVVGLSLTAQALGMLVFGILALGLGMDWKWLWAGLLAASLLVVLPIGLGVLSEAVIAWLSGVNGSTPLVGPPKLSATITLGVIALLTLVGFAAWTAGVANNTVGILLVLAAILIIMLALASSTHADVAILMAAVALVGVTPLQQGVPAPMSAAAPPGESLSTLVALGDSYMSGEGADVYYRGTDDAGGNQCRRAPSAWAALASDHRFQAFEFLACSGATTHNVIYTPKPGDSRDAIPSDPGAHAFQKSLGRSGIVGPQAGEHGTQLDRWRANQQARGLTPSLVVVSLGGNDAGFSTIGAMCLAPGSCSERADLWRSSLPQVRARLRLTYAEISETFPQTPVVTVAYPDPIHQGYGECTQVSLTRDERNFIHDFLTGTGGLNEVIESTSAEFGFYHVPEMEQALAAAHLQLCDPLNDDQPGVNFVGIRSVRGAAEQRFNPVNWVHSSLHPNERGHTAMLRTFQAWYAAEQPKDPRRLIAPEQSKALEHAMQAWATEPDQQAQETVDQAGQCDLFATSKFGCRTIGTDWALREIRDLLLARGLWICLLAGFLALSVAAVLLATLRRTIGRRASRH